MSVYSVSSGEESNDLMMNNLDIEEIDKKLSFKRKKMSILLENIDIEKNSPKRKITDDANQSNNKYLKSKENEIVIKKESGAIKKEKNMETSTSVKTKMVTEGSTKIKTEPIEETTEVKFSGLFTAEVKDNFEGQESVKNEDNIDSNISNKENVLNFNQEAYPKIPTLKGENSVITKEQRELIKAQKEERQFLKLLAEEEKKMNAERKLQERQRKEEERRIADEEKRKRKEEERVLFLKRLEEREEEKKIAAERKERERLERAEHKKKLEEEAAAKRKEQALKGIKYLLSVSEKYSEFYTEKLAPKEKGEKQIATKPQDRNKFVPTVDDMKEAVKVQTRKSDINKNVDITKQLKYFQNGKLHPYQVEGVTWLKELFDNGINGILADEMGLGKTVQVIALVSHLFEIGVTGPYLIVVPLSTLTNWKSEFKRFAPRIPTVVFYGMEAERKELYRVVKRKYKLDNISTYPVILTSYQVPMSEHKFLSQFEYQYIIVDEGHRIKNHETQLSVALRNLNSANRILLTGTPLQNNITELWSLLNFLMPHLFTNMDTFASLLMLEDMQDGNKIIEAEEKTNLLNTLHRVLKPFMLRRLKKDVLQDLVPKKETIINCPMSKLQKTLYKSVIEKNLSTLQMKEDDEFKIEDIFKPRPKRKCVLRKKTNYALTDFDDLSDLSDDSDFEDALVAACEGEDLDSSIKKEVKPFAIRLTMTNPMMMFRKIVDHPYLIHFPLEFNEEGKRSLLINEDLVSVSGKMMVLDVLLDRLKKKGHKVLIFSTLVMTLDLVEELLIMRGHEYRRIDGSSSLEERGEGIEEFNKDPKILAFLLSTRAGGLGLNLTGADTCVFFDRDWNPQADIQAEARCHRIGQTRPVMVYTLVAKNTIDEQIITRGYHKRLLEKLVIQDGKFRHIKQGEVSKTRNELEELKELLNSEADKPFEEEFSNEVLDKLLDRTDLYDIMKKMKK